MFPLGRQSRASFRFGHPGHQLACWGGSQDAYGDLGRPPSRVPCTSSPASRVSEPRGPACGASSQCPRAPGPPGPHSETQKRAALGRFL